MNLTRVNEESRIFDAIVAIWLNDLARLYFAHPAFWAPFVVVGEGGIARH